MVSTPTPNGFADHYPYEKWLFHWGYTPFSDIPILQNMTQISTRPCHETMAAIHGISMLTAHEIPIFQTVKPIARSPGRNAAAGWKPMALWTSTDAPGSSSGRPAPPRSAWGVSKWCSKWCLPCVFFPKYGKHKIMGNKQTIWEYHE